MLPEPENLLERVLWWMAKHLPGRVLAALAALSYLGLGLAVPLALELSKPVFVAFNVYGTGIAFLIILVWVMVQIARRDRRHLLEWNSDMRLLEAAEFEWLVGELFRREGWTVVERGRQDAGDGNIDLELRRGPDRRLVQCKRWTTNWVGVDEIRKFAGALTREKLPASAGIFVTFSDFTQQASEEAKQLDMELLNKIDLHARIEKVRRVEPCPTCQAPMVLDRSMHGWWFRCVVPGCGGKRDLGKDAGRAIALITEEQ